MTETSKTTGIKSWLKDDRPREKFMYCQDSTCIMTGTQLKYLCAFMNSKLGYQMLYDKAPKTGTGDVIVSVQAIEPLLIPSITPTNKGIVERIEDIVDKILSAKKQNSRADTGEYEKQIDRMVYELYGLTEEEIAIVERGVRRSNLSN